MVYNQLILLAIYILVWVVQRKDGPRWAGRGDVGDFGVELWICILQYIVFDKFVISPFAILVVSVNGFGNLLD